MVSPALSREKLEETVKVLIDCGGRRDLACLRLGLARSTLQNRLKKAAALGYKIPEAIGGTQKLADRDIHSYEARKARRLEAELAEAKRDLKKALERADIAEDIRHGLLGLKNNPPEPPKWPLAPNILGVTELLPILFTSDFQCGEVIDPKEVDGMNAYNMDIFAERYSRLIDRTLDISDHHVGNASFPGVYYLRGGDAISGGIHEELVETDDLSAVPAVRWLVMHEREGIKRLLDRFGRVRVISIPGNHGRTTKKPRSKGYVTHNFETLLAWWLESSFAGDSNVEFVIPASGEAYFDAVGWKMLLAHGDRMGSRGGTGFLGPIATIMRGHQRLHQNWERSGWHVDFVLTGHLHESVKTPLGYGNGALSGYSEYARDLRAIPSPPMQWLFFMHKERAVSVPYEIQVGDRPLRRSPNIGI